MRKGELEKEKILAMKTIRKDSLTTDQHMFQLVDEIKLQRQMHSCAMIPKIVRIHETAKEVKIVMEYIPGEPLSKMIKGKMVFSERDIRLLATQLLLSVDLMSKLNIVHRDIKPQNIMMIEEQNSMKFPPTKPP